MKTLVEFCDREPAHNIMMCLKYMPERLVFISYHGLTTEARMAALKSFLASRGWKKRIEFIPIDRFDVAQTAEVIRRILERYEDCAFDLTGGNELAVLALGLVAAERPLKVYQADVRSGRCAAVLGEAEKPANPLPEMSAAELVALHGGRVKQNGKRPEPTEEMLADLDVMWEIYQDDYRAWKSQTEAFMNSGGYKNEYAQINTRESAAFRRSVFDRLREAGMVTDCSESGGVLTFRFKNRDVHKLLADTGSILELQVLRAAKLLPRVFTDAVACVVIDWDGVLHNPLEGERDTLNEIDGILMRGMTPVFVSCKSGLYDRNSLYELDVVTPRFGGGYAVKLLVVNDPKQVKGSEYLRQRAADMGIRLLENAYTYKARELAERLEELTG